MDTIINIMIEKAKAANLKKEVLTTYYDLRERFPEKGIEWAAVSAQKEWGL